MNSFAVEIWYDEGKICTFYTVRWVTSEKVVTSETDKFFDTYTEAGHTYEDEALQLFELITVSIGDKYGATDDFFDRQANRAQELPPKPKHTVEEIKLLGINFPLRLFCCRVSSQIVILFNGGVKESQATQDSPSLSTKLYESDSFVKKIEEALRDQTIHISDDGRYLFNYDDPQNIIL